jgi:hypothetical protein
MKVDDTSWHTGTEPNEVQAGMHIALVFCWLVVREFLVLPKRGGKDWAKLFTSKRSTPGEVFQGYTDGKLMTDEVSDVQVVEFLNEWYESRYLMQMIDQGELVLQRDAQFLPPYDFADTWANVDDACKIFDTEFKQWASKQQT